MQKTDFYFKSVARGAHLVEFWGIARNSMGLKEIFFYLLMGKSLPQKNYHFSRFLLDKPENAPENARIINLEKRKKQWT